eukprot:s529_g9.t3
MEAHLKELQNFSHDSDPRVATLIQRAAQGASRAAMALAWDEDVLDAAPWTVKTQAPEEVRLRDVDAVDAPEHTGDGGAKNPRGLDRDRLLEPTNPAIIGRRSEEVPASSLPSAPSSTPDDQNLDDKTVARRCCWCCWPRQQAPQDDEEDSLLTPKQGVGTAQPKPRPCRPAAEGKKTLCPSRGLESFMSCCYGVHPDGVITCGLHLETSNIYLWKMAKHGIQMELLFEKPIEHGPCYSRVTLSVDAVRLKAVAGSHPWGPATAGTVPGEEAVGRRDVKAGCRSSVEIGDLRGNLCRTAEKPSAGDRTHRMEDVLVATLTVQNSHSMFQVTFEFGECTLQTQMMDHMSTLLNNFAETRLAEMM